MKTEKANEMVCESALRGGLMAFLSLVDAVKHSGCLVHKSRDSAESLHSTKKRCLVAI